MDLDKIKVLVRAWVKDTECCLDRLAQIYSEELMILERAGAAGKDEEAMNLYEEFDKALQNSYKEVEEVSKKTNCKRCGRFVDCINNRCSYCRAI